MATQTPRRARALLAPVAVLALLAGPALIATTGGTAHAAVRPASLDPGLAGSGTVRVVVSGTSVAEVRRAVTAAHGTHLRPLEIIHGVAASLPASEVAGLAQASGVTAITADRAVQLTTAGWDDQVSASAYAWTSQATAQWAQSGNRGSGVGIAVLDTGVSSIHDLDGRLLQGPDLSGEGQNTVDSFGHGTVMAGIAAGDGTSAGSKPRTGVAPGANVISVKVAGRNGATDISTILSGLSWVAAFKDVYDIRVLNLSWGVPSTQDPLVDPLNFAVERLWSMGVTVIAAAGNSGPTAGTILKPGDDPLVVTVGAYDDKGDSSASNDSIPAWSSQGPTAQGRMKPDLVAPGRTLIAPRSPGSLVEVQNPQALVGSAYIKASGTSEATAVTSGAAALLLAAHPSWTPDQVKYALTSSATRLSGVPATLQGAGRLQVKAAGNAYVGMVVPQLPAALGTGVLDRGTAAALSVTCDDGVSRVITGNATSYCAPWTGAAWTGAAWTGAAWTGAAWTGAAWTGAAWTGAAWTGAAWTGAAWTGAAWTGAAWTGAAWTGAAWTGAAWTGAAWTSADYDGSGAAPSPADGSAGTSYQGGFPTAFYGDQPKAGRTVVGEVSALLPPLGQG